MFKYCTQVLHLSEQATYLRLEAAQMIERFPAILPALQGGALSLSAIKLLAPALTEDNCGALIDAAQHRSKSEIEALLARWRPRPDVPNTVRKLPTRAAVVEVAGIAETAETVETVEVIAVAATSVSVNEARTGCAEKDACVGAPEVVAPGDEAAMADVDRRAARETRASRPVIAPLAAERYRVQFTASEALHAQIRRARTCSDIRFPAAIWRKLDSLATLVERLNKCSR
jgi:hypothetical protein